MFAVFAARTSNWRGLFASDNNFYFELCQLEGWFETTEGRDWGVIKLGCQVEGGICEVLAIAKTL